VACFYLRDKTLKIRQVQMDQIHLNFMAGILLIEESIDNNIIY